MGKYARQAVSCSPSGVSSGSYLSWLVSFLLVISTFRVSAPVSALFSLSWLLLLLDGSTTTHSEISTGRSKPCSSSTITICLLWKPFTFPPPTVLRKRTVSPTDNVLILLNILSFARSYFLVTAVYRANIFVIWCKVD